MSQASTPPPWGQRLNLLFRLFGQNGLILAALILAWSALAGLPASKTPPSANSDNLRLIQGDLKQQEQQQQKLQSDLESVRTTLGAKADRLALDQIKREIAPKIQDRASASDLLGLKDRFTNHEYDLSQLKKDLAELQKRPVKVSPGPDGDPKTFQELRAQFVQFQTKLASLENLQKELKKQNETIAEHEKKLRDFGEKVTRLPHAEPTDVVVVGLHSQNLSLHNYLDVFREMVDPGRRALLAGSRIGFLLDEGGDVQVLAPLDGKQADEVGKRFARVTPAREGTIDRMEGLAARVREQFKDQKARYRHCVVVASVACQPPPREQYNDWKDVPVHVILIGTDKRVRELEVGLLQNWYRFTRSCKGSLTLLSAEGDREVPDKDLLEQLRGCLWQATQPLFPLTKR